MKALRNFEVERNGSGFARRHRHLLGIKILDGRALLDGAVGRIGLGVKEQSG
jgi:hypothetical protein